jgi:hypothetical protein
MAAWSTKLMKWKEPEYFNVNVLIAFEGGGVVIMHANVM